MEAQKRRRNSLDKYLQEREEWKRIEKERMEEENRKILEFAKQQAEVNTKIKAVQVDHCLAG
jgi:hypothetical protein